MRAAEEDRLRRIRREFALAGSGIDVENIIRDARPIVASTWNHYISAISADSDRDDLYAKHLLALARELIQALTPEVCSDASVLRELKKLAAKRDDWPGLISKNKAKIARAKKQCETLGVGTLDGRNNPKPATGPVAKFADELLKKLRDYAQRLPSDWPKQPKYWKFHYIKKIPPPFTVAYSNFWTRFAETVLDMDHGPGSVRAAARQRHFKHSLPRLSASDQEEKIQRLEEQDAELATQLGYQSRSRKLPHWEDEPPPCILAQSAFRDYAKRLTRRDQKNKDGVKSPEAAYNQLKKQIIRAVKVRLPKAAIMP